MQNPQHVTIGLLLAVAAVLGMLVLATSGPEPSARADTSVSGGNYILVSGEWSSSLDLIYIINIATRRMNVYWYNQNMDSVELVDSIDLARTFGRERR